MLCLWRRLGLSLCIFPLLPQTKVRNNDLFRYRVFPLSPSGVRQAGAFSRCLLALLGQKDLGRLEFRNAESCCSGLEINPGHGWEKSSSCCTAV